MPRATTKEHRIRRSIGTIRGVKLGRIQVRVSCTNSELKALNDFLTGLILQEDLETLRYAMQSGRHLQIARNRHLRGEQVVMSAQTSRLALAFDTWLENPTTKGGKSISPATHNGYRKTAKTLLKYADPEATPEMLVDAVRKYREYCVLRNQNSRFNQALTVAKSFARSMEGRGSSLYRALRDEVDAMHTERKRERKANITPRMVRRIMRQMTEQGDGHLAQHIWNICALAARIDEYVTETPADDWKIQFLPNRKAVYIAGTKFSTAKRFVPLLPGVKPAPNRVVRKTGKRHGRMTAEKRGTLPFYSLSALTQAFKRTTKTLYKPADISEEFELYDLRASGLTWMRRAGVDPIMRKVYFAHSLRGIDERYSTFGSKPQWADFAEDVKRDRRKMVRWLRQQVKRKASASG